VKLRKNTIFAKTKKDLANTTKGLYIESVKKKTFGGIYDIIKLNRLMKMRENDRVVSNDDEEIVITNK